MVIKHLNISVKGSVQGVFFRYSAKQEAEKLNLSGFARNEPGGSVYIEIEGEEDKLNQFLEWCKEGSEAAKVEKVEVSDGKIQKFTEFTIQ